MATGKICGGQVRQGRGCRRKAVWERWGSGRIAPLDISPSSWRAGAAGLGRTMGTRREAS
ncbi:hypothetical protein E2562_001790 [Oryza meyeriana var. granulata]|uniref:Uncharacterized protein n=1 Tax=Oryza meyeriana var. granulata TaxID=110450 RepID=A0A6G1CD95_9ORYZ|nr:hypothetical protein E2562_001790 [Oryza meyeriana var. granulata]